MENPFKQIEPDANCPPHLREQIVSEIDMIRNALTVVELYTGDLFGALSALLSDSSETPPTNS
ncbi:hypothetical protein J2I47_14485 [Fibrella sp. HMF5335]|uniref:Uncharacterized protein n=1 Tax=Fibrella rubiginis TaxID=2817060 RepID=A0A939K5H3_9BACT|nr:hypothetical protein [Fibrella rubiginis]MBO0937763.1 hypothetical protein [Fibrella rubiginis]